MASVLFSRPPPPVITRMYMWAVKKCLNRQELPGFHTRSYLWFYPDCSIGRKKQKFGFLSGVDQVNLKIGQMVNINH